MVSLVSTLVPVIEAITGIFALFLTYRTNKSLTIFYLRSIIRTFSKSKRHRYNLGLWYFSYFFIIVCGVLYAFTITPANVKGPFLFSILDTMLGLYVIYGLFFLFSKNEVSERLKERTSFGLSLIAELILSVALILVFFVGYVITLSIAAVYIQTLPKDYQGEASLVYIFTFIFVYFGLAFYIISFSLKPALIWMINTSLNNEEKTEVNFKGTKDEFVQLQAISSLGLHLTFPDSSVGVMTWTSLRSMNIRKVSHKVKSRNKNQDL